MLNYPSDEELYPFTWGVSSSSSNSSNASPVVVEAARNFQQAYTNWRELYGQHNSPQRGDVRLQVDGKTIWLKPIEKKLKSRTLLQRAVIERHSALYRIKGNMMALTTQFFHNVQNSPVFTPAEKERLKKIVAECVVFSFDTWEQVKENLAESVKLPEK